MVLSIFFSISTSVEDASAQRVRNGSGFHSGGVNAVFGGRGAGAVHAHDHAAVHRAFRDHRARRPYGIAPVVVYSGGYIGSDDNCVFEQRLVWNGWATLRELVTICQ